MESFLDTLTESFHNRDSGLDQLAVLPGNLDSGCWRLDHPVPVDEIINAFRIQDELVQPTGAVVIPVHEEDSANLTGEFLVYHYQDEEELLRERAEPHELHYLNSESGGTDFELVSECTDTYLAYRTRFWHSTYSPPENPEFLPSEYYDDRPPSPPRTLEAVSPLSETEYDSFVEDVRVWLEDELQAAIQSAWDSARNMSIQRIKREHGGDGISSTVASLSDDSQLNVSAPGGTGRNPVENTYGVFQGNIVAVAVGDEEEQPEIVGIVPRVGLTEFDINLDLSVIDDPDRVLHRIGDADLVSVAVVDRNIAHVREREAFNSMVGTSEGRRLLSGQEPLTFDSPLSAELETNLSLNRYQTRAAINALRTNDAYCIHGPPGTGKTRTLTAVIESAVRSGSRVLVCAHSNQAVDNLIAGDSSLDSIDENSLHGIVHENDFRLVRFGNRENIESRVVESNYAGDPSSRTQIVATTTNSAERLDSSLFDLVVVDEATQASIPATSIPFPLGPSIVLAGDHKQLPPFNASETDSDEDIHPSLFEHVLGVFGDSINTTLRRQYRMNQLIADFSNTEFYDELLLHGPSNRDATIADLDPLLGIHIQEEEVARGNSWANPREAEVVSAQVNTLLNRDVSPQDIGVITPYTGQRTEVLEVLGESFDRGVVRQIKVQTIDAFQGGEREAIIVSFTRSNPQGRSGFLEFPNEGPRRLNVALTRAKKRLVLIGNWETLSTQNPQRSDGESCTDVYERLLHYLQESGVMVGY